MKITLIVVDNCPACKRAQSVLTEFTDTYNNIVFGISNLEELNSYTVPIVPALFINDKLFCYGDIDTVRLSEYIASH